VGSIPIPIANHTGYPFNVQLEELILDKHPYSISEETGRVAHVIALDGSMRFPYASSTLQQCGFAHIVRVRPIPWNGPRALAFARLFGLNLENTTGPSPLRQISVTLTHVGLWRGLSRLAHAPSWIYLFEDDVMLNPHALAHTQTRDINMQSTVEGQVMQVLDGAERVSEGYQWPIMYMHHCAPILPRSVGHGSKLDGPISLPLWHLLRPCSALCVTAYAFRRENASAMWPTLRSRIILADREKKIWKALNPYYRFNIDTTMRGYYYRGGRNVPAATWPVCLDYPAHVCNGGSTNPGRLCGGGLFIPNASWQSVGEHNASMGF